MGSLWSDCGSCDAFDNPDRAQPIKVQEDRYRVHASEVWGNKLRANVSGMQGQRPTMEDTYIIHTRLDPLPNTSLFGVCDGHGGKFSAKYVAGNLGRAISEALNGYRPSAFKQLTAEALTLTLKLTHL